MAIYTVTTSNWNDIAFWSAVNETGSGHTIDFSGLPSVFDVVVDADSGLVTLSDGAASFQIGDQSYAGAADATLGGTTLWNFFTTTNGSAGEDTVDGGFGSDVIDGGAGGDSLTGSIGNDTIDGGSGDDFISAGVVSGTPTDLGPGLITTTLHYSVTSIGDLRVYDASTDTETQIANGLQTYGDIAMTPEGQLIGIQLSGSSINLIDADTGAETVLATVTNGFHASLVANSNGDLYYTTTNTLSVIPSNGDGTYGPSVDLGDLGGNVTDLVFTDDNTLYGAFNGDIIQVGLDPATGLMTGITNLGPVVAGQTDIWGLSIGEDGRLYAFEGSGELHSSDLAASPFVWQLEPNTTVGGGQVLVYGATNSGDVQTLLTNIAGNDSDVVDGGAGNDTILGGIGADTIDGGVGADQIDGGDGDDVIALTDGFGSDTIIGGEGDETAGDTLDLSGTTTGVTVDLSNANPETGTVSDGTDTASFTEIENIVLGAGRDTITLADGSGDDTVQAFDMVDSGDGSTNDQLDVSALTSDGGTTPVTTSDVTVTDTNGDGSGDAILTFPGGESITLTGVATTQVDSQAELAAIGIPLPLDYIVEGTAAGEVINAGYGGDPDGDKIDNEDHSDGSNDDSVQAGGGNDTIGSGLGDDTVDAGDGDDVVYAEVGNDEVIGGQGSDSLFGEGGNDTLQGGTEADSLDGGDGNDLLEGGAGNDTLWGQADNDTLDGGDDNDFINGGFGDDLIQGGEGNDTLEGWFGNDTIEGGAGNDYIDADNDSDLVLAGDGDDTVVGGFSISADTIYGGAGNDSLNGQAGDDLLYGGTGNDVQLGAEGDDTFFLEDDFGADTITGAETDETIGDTLDLTNVTEDTTIDLSDANSETGSVSNGTDTATFTQIENIVLGGGRDTIELADGSGDDAVYAFDMTDSGDGTTNDQLDVSALTSDGGTTPVNTSDVVVTDTNGDGTGNAILTFPGGETMTLVGVLASQVDSPAELISIGIPAASGPVDGLNTGEAMGIGYVDAQGDIIDGADGLNDTIFGNDGADTINAGAGNDTVDGGADQDVFVAEDGFGQDVIIGGEAGIDEDTIDVSALTSGVTLRATGTDAGTITNGSDTLTFSEVEALILTDQADSVNAGADSDGANIDAGAGDDDIENVHGNSSVAGGAGNDTIVGVSADGEAATATLDGGAGNDFIDGADRSDLIFGGAGNDTLEAGEENTFGDLDTIFGGTGDDLITSAELDAGSSDMLYGDEGNDTITVSGGDANLLSGGDGQDQLQSAAGNDTLDGGADEDTIIVTDDFGNDTIIGGEGTTTGTDFDTLDLSATTTGVTVDLSSATPESGTISDGTDTANFTEIENVILGGGRDTVTLGDGSGDDAVDAFDMTDSGDGSTNDQLDVSDLTSDGGTTPVDTSDVTVTDTNGDGTGDAILTFPGGESITLIGVLPSEVDSPAELESIGIPAAPGLNFIVEGTAAGELIDASYAGDPQGDMVDALDHSDSSNADSIQAGAGDDTVFAGLDDDTVDAGDGADEVHGGDGDDDIFGGAQNDSLYGGVGNDTLAGGDGDDSLESWVGNDVLEGNAGNDYLDGADGDDTLLGGSDNDTLLGGNGGGADSLDGGTGDDSLSAGDGDDTLLGGTGDDTMFGASGDDVFVLEDSFGNDTIDGWSTGETAGDTLDLSAVTTDTTVDLTSNDPEAGSVTDGVGTATFVEIENIVLGGGRDTITLADGSGDDIVQAFDMADSGDGSTNDQLDVTALTSDGGTTPVTTQDVTVTDTNGDGTGDAILTFPGGESITLVGVLPAEVDTPAELESIGIPAPGPNFIVEGTASGEVIDASYADDPQGDMIDALDHSDNSNADSIQAGGGADTITAGLDNDTIEGGTGDDVIYGGSGDDLAFGEDDDDLIYGGTGNDTADGGAGNDYLSGGTGEDSLVGGSGNDDFDGGDGNDTLEGGIGNDNIDGDADNDSILGGSGNDSMWGGSGNDTLDGGTGDDAIYAETGNDEIDAGAGVDYIQLTSGNDTVQAGDDNDSIDVIAGGYSEGAVVTADGGTGGVDSDTLNLGSWDAFRNLSQTPDLDADSTSGSVELQDAAGNWITVNFTEIENLNLPPTNLTPNYIVEGTGDANVIDALYLGDPEGDRIDNSDHSDGSNDDLVIAGAGDDLVVAGAGNDTVFGNDDNDTLQGGAGDDELDGDAGDDSLQGGTGNDTLVGDFGDDTLEGGDDDDELYASTGSNDLSGGAGNDLMYGGDGNDLLDGGSGNDTLVGNEGSDTLDGGAGDDSIRGDDGDDLFTLQDGFGNDTIIGGENAETNGDTLDLSGTTTGVTVDLSDADPETGTVSDGVDTAGFTEIENIVLGGGRDTVGLGDGGGDDSVDAFDMTDSGDGTTVDQLDVSGLTSDGGTTPVTTLDVTVTDTNGDGTGDAILTFPGGESITLVGVLPAEVDTPAELESIGIPAPGPNYIVEGTAGDDTIDAGYLDDPQGDLIDADDNLALNDDDSVVAGAGNDSVDAGSGDDTVLGGTGNDTLSGNVGDDILEGDAGNDLIDGEIGDDTLDGGAGADTIDGAEGDDVILLQDGFGNDIIDGGQTTEVAGDTLDLSGTTTGVTVDLTDANPEDGTVSDGTDTATFVDIENIILGGGRDTVALGDGGGDDSVEAFDMADSGDGTTVDQLDVSGLTSDGGTTPVNTSDVLVTDTNGDGTGDAILTFPGGETITLVGVLPSQVDTEAELEAIGIPGTGAVDGTAGNDAMPVGYVDAEGDIIDGADGLNDTIFGYGGNDTIDGGAGDDTIDAGADDDSITAGAGDDEIIGGDGSDVFVYGAGDGNDTITDFNAGNAGTLDDGDASNNDSVDLSGYYDHISELYADQADDGILNQSNALDTRGNAVDYSDNTDFGAGSLTLDGVSADSSGLTVENTGVVCFTTGTAIRTPYGDVLIDDLQVGDLVSTLDNGPQRIRWIGHRSIGAAELQTAPNLRPVLIRRGVLGAERDLFVSRQHGMLVGRDHLVRAAHLAKAMSGVRVAHGKQEVTYVHLMFDDHQILFAEGTQSESFYPGPMALDMMSSAPRAELLLMFPELAHVTADSLDAHPYGATVRGFISHKALKEQDGSAQNALHRMIAEMPD